MKKPINELALQMAIAHAQAEYYHELRTGTIPEIKKVPIGVERFEHFSDLVGEAYQYFNDMTGTDAIIDRRYYELEDASPASNDNET